MGRMKKRLTKRKTLKLKYKIERKVRESNKKQRKNEKKHPTKKKQDLGIPNAWPFKEEELKDYEIQRAKVHEEKERQKEARRKEREKRRKLIQAELAAGFQGGKLSESDLAAAQSRAAEFDTAHDEDGDEAMGDTHSKQRGLSQRNHIRELKKMVEMSDVLLEVLDARDPMGCRCRALELAIEGDVNKRLILVLNKIDLVPRDAVQKWLTYLRQSYPTIAFKASTQQRGRVHQSGVNAGLASEDLLKSTECLGADTLVQLLKNYSRSHNMKKAIVAGVFGYPNVGKSSLINSLKRSKAVGVSPCPGFTRTVTEIHLDKNIRLVDCPGVVFDASPSEQAREGVQPEVILRNALGVDKVQDPARVVEAIIARCSALGIARHYRIGMFSNVNEFLIQISQIRGKIGKGGVCDLDAAAKCVLQDWNTGKIPFYTLPPITTPSTTTSSESMTDSGADQDAVIVGSWAKEFDIGELFAAEAKALEESSSLPKIPSSRFIAMTSGSAGGMLNEDDLSDDDN